MTNAVFQIFRAVLCVVLIVAATFVVAGVESTVVGSTLGGGGATSITSGTTPVSGGGNTQVCFNDSATIACGDAGMTYIKGTDTLGVLGGIELGHATDTTIARSSAGAVTIEGGTVAKLNTANSWTAAQTFSGGFTMPPDTGAVIGSTLLGDISAVSSLTPDAPTFLTGTTSNSWHIYEFGDAVAAFDFNNGPCGAAACTNPTLIIHSTDQSITEYSSIHTDNTNGDMVLTSGAGRLQIAAPLRGSIYKTADESVASSTVLQDDDHLTVTLGASASYWFKFFLFHNNVGALEGIKVAVSGTAGVTSLKAQITITDDTTNTTAALARVTAFGSAVGAGLGAGDNYTEIQGVIETSTAGTFLLQFAQNASGTNAVTMQRGSSLVALRIN